MKHPLDQSLVSNADRSRQFRNRLFEQAKVSQQKKRAIAQQNERSKPKDCTFTPRINRNANSKKCSRNRSGKKRIGDRLYSDFLSRKIEGKKESKNVIERTRHTNAEKLEGFGINVEIVIRTLTNPQQYLHLNSKKVTIRK